MNRLLTLGVLAVCCGSSALAQPAATRKAIDTVRPQSSPVQPRRDGPTVMAPASALVDVNSATAAQLEAVPGIGKAYAAKIIAGRPYASKLQLLQRKLLPQAAYEKAKAHLVARQ